MHGRDGIHFFRRQRLTAPDLLDHEFHETVGDEVADMFEVDHGRQDLPSTCALLLVIERLLVAEIGEVAADCAAQPLDSGLLRANAASQTCVHPTLWKVAVGLCWDRGI